tara:strand:- start:246 stop:665 length:420 start_codon:yes stop_codon:yes gene_type:complete
MNGTLSFEIHNDLLEIDRAHDLLDEFSTAHQLSDGMNLKIKLSVEELLNNVISYGYTDEDTHIIFVNITLQDSVVSIRITHDGDPFNPHDAPQPQLMNGDLQDLQIGGLGVFLVKEMMDSLDYRRDGRQNIIEIKKRLI